MDIRIKKRDGKLQEYKQGKIKKAILAAFNECKESVKDLDSIIVTIVEELSEFLDTNSTNIVDIEVIQDLVEEVLMQFNSKVAKHYITYRQKRAEQRQERLTPDSGAIADYIHISKYSRFNKELGRRELYEETVSRVEDMHIRKYPNCIDDIQFAFSLVRDKKVLPSMRSMQFAGAAIEAHNARMYNCSYTLINRPRVFGEILYLLLCGCGVGFSVQWEHINQLPKLEKIGKTVKHFTIPDSIEGWAEAVNALVQSFLTGYHVEFNYSQIRPEGSLLITSGGLAPGHLPLKRSLENIRQLLLKAQNRKLRPIECHDVICYLAEAVLAGGIRRSSLISIFSAHDTEMLYAKAQGNFDPIREINAQRAMANNSAMIIRKSLSYGVDHNKEIFKRVIHIAEENYGDPGFFFSNSTDYGCNPCAEIGLNPVLTHTKDGRVGDVGFSFCNLCEINMAKVTSEEDYIIAAEAAAIIGTLQAGYTTFPFLGEVTEQIVKRDGLLGVSMCGMMDNPDISFNYKLQCIAARHVLKINEKIAKKIGIEPAKRATTIKPGGTAPLELGGVASGIHPHHARRYIRRVTANPLEPALLHFEKINPHMVETKPNGDKCIMFPIEVPSDAKTVKEMPALEFMNYVFDTYRNWIQSGKRDLGELSHSVSATITVKPEEMNDVVKLLHERQFDITGMSFAPYLLDKRFPFTPREAITPADESKWNYLIQNYRPVDWTMMCETGQEVLNPEIECSGQKTCSLG
ncbi:MAG: ATP cone domain-containing protein [Desulfobacteraceae bacterium]|jgi:ribonucleoside-diphosphate reductase alpha chain